jgi:hypothetical protein
MYERSLSFNSTFVEFCSISHWNSPFAVTLTVKDCISGINAYQGLSHTEAQKSFKQFLRMLKAEIYTKSQLRKQKRVRCIPILNFITLRYHLCIDKPSHLTAEEFASLIYACWMKTSFGDWSVDVQPNASQWIEYIARARSQPPFSRSPVYDYQDVVDWQYFWIE